MSTEATSELRDPQLDIPLVRVTRGEAAATLRLMRGEPLPLSDRERLRDLARQLHESLGDDSPGLPPA